MIGLTVNIVTEGSVITPKGFQATGVHAGIRKVRKDLGLIYCDVPASCAAVYTQSHFQAAPLRVTQQSIAVAHKLQAIVVNSGNANACTGAQGEKDAYEMRSLTAKHCGVAEHLVAVASTGVIGEVLPMEKIRTGIGQLMPTSAVEQADSFYEAILTTDLVTKRACYQTVIDGKTITVGGAAKGSGMIHPNMATMLAFITTDAVIESDVLQRALSSITNCTFNQITVDGETSTNDMVIVMASGLAGNDSLHEAHVDWPHFYEALKEVCESLAKQIAKDGEGATKLIEVNVKGAVSTQDAQIAAKKIVGSALVKTAVYGEDANWGRIIGALGHSEIVLNPANIDIYIGEFCVLKQSEPQVFSEEAAARYLAGDTIVIYVDLHMGAANGTAWGCDLSYDYVKINASYRT
ncbi:bifunctional ornithine acetyltransferase/N-acetylglutamate synthase [Ectobacillus antri]|jgi:glutamate N-acetyltransferase/amino-acid N-acetyltransferase|uniref:Arginine biosynthesis bifunctional protein ArgJ n=1 Tax=Ectobacillus antri TaxID=2486280 RepID=A0ABT6H3P2_9BACI|nr:bifunctional ornithine acetyltransferase/N-acetylglutamate synthase [Ectobacillus antri]MDG4655650.1 bifunctional ornithine acetyltransferase/N-acetylglutamate synthase [Ectobacillus antri]MDG5753408.1 bifunctional ornithine acetyltransferase/N-acetylglutamate synthase [Ectobacillus antri]